MLLLPFSLLYVLCYVFFYSLLLFMFESQRLLGEILHSIFLKTEPIVYFPIIKTAECN